MLRWGRVEASGGFLLIMAWLNYWDTQGLLGKTVLACVLHELGHYIVIRWMGGQVGKLRLTAAGAEIQVIGTLSYGKEILYTLAGPAINVALATGMSKRDPVFSGINLALAYFNLLPLSCLDGGRIVSAMSAFLFGERVAVKTKLVLDKLVAILLWGLGWGALGLASNPVLLCMAVWASFTANPMEMGEKGLVKRRRNRYNNSYTQTAKRRARKPT